MNAVVGIMQQYRQELISEGQAAALIVKGLNVDMIEARNILKGKL